MTTMIDRVLAVSSVVGLAPGLFQLSMQGPGLAVWWLLPFCVLQGVVVLGMVVQATRRRPFRPWAGAFAVLTLVAVSTFPSAAPPVLVGPQPFLWWQVGLAVVCAGLWRGIGAGVGYGVLLAAAWTVARTTPAGGATGLTIAAAEGVFGVVAGIVIAVVARGMLDSAVAADARAREVSAVELRQAVEKALAEERARLDQLIHDDVMTTLAAAAHSTEATTGRATALLARHTLAVIDARPEASADGVLSVSVLARLVEQTVRRVSPDVVLVERVDVGAALSPVPSAVAGSVLTALREAVRNTVHHAQARRTEVELRAGLRAGTLHLVVRVVDDGRGFDLTAVAADRFGVRGSMLEACRRVGVRPRLRTAPGRGTEFELGWSGSAVAPERVVVVPPGADDRLPVDFPTGQFVAAVWAAVGVGVGVGLVTFGSLESPPAVLTGMVVVLLATYLVLAPYDGLRLPLGVTVVVVALEVALALLMTQAVVRYDQPDVLHWHTFPADLVMVVLVVRGRPGWAVGALLAVEAGITWTCITSGLGWGGLLRAGSGQVLVVAVVILVTRVLRAISRRQVVLRSQEDAALDASARQHVALVQRALWMADLRAQSRSVLERLSEGTGPVPVGLRQEALLVEATLRESLVARNVMSDELAVLTEDARRRGVDVRLVDSRSTALPPRLGTVLLDVVRRSLATSSVARLVVRLAPEDGELAASVLTEDSVGTRLVRIDAFGVLTTSEVETRGA
ncbi:ATP-binding protein [Microlunatus antarcticus]|uniref:Signal transduction histidine kinase n=1 Tax=Microlunatus antarcticus TaxID=53388 RepID=A0A7W5P7Z8_9ACTN|nr:ATP-binding protein [Microlunatus antarcticus]MBB3327411.1 signal transduction histidine kinase [Microlunatus antarcticus]